ncbi:MAG TPA: anaerobic glycerol-3-phosphate dehydrogenase subunit C [Acidobacteriota bacterium]|nr:anaerobic glycerol-3-phosphate dehydrogenase subunit C [Acidobacteriota bacterium]
MLNPKEATYWDEKDMRKELDRIYDICHGCRLCFNLCPSFTNLFKYIDDKDGEVKELSRIELDNVTDLCYQCKLCYIKCPYTPPHNWDVDFPRLLLRDKAVRVKREGVSFQDRALGNPDRTGKIGCRSAALANWTNRNPAARFVMEKTIGVHRDRTLPEFHAQTFSDWFHSRKKRLESEKKVAFFATCFVNYNDPQQGIAAVEVLEKNGYEVLYPKQVCCGMPFIDGGDVSRATANMEENVREFQEVIDAEIPIVSPGPTCSYVLKNELPYFTGDSNAFEMAEHTQDICEFLVSLKAKKELNTEFVHTPPMRIGYQIPCHLRAQNLGYKSMELLRTIPNVDVELMENCSAMDGTWGMKKQFYQISLKLADKLLKEVKNVAPDEVCTDCPLSGIQIHQGTGKKPVHPVQILHRAYGLQDRH